MPQPAVAATAVQTTASSARPQEVSLTRRTRLRVRLRRPWFSSGDDERIGIVLWPPNVFGLKAEDVQQDVLRKVEPGGDEIELRDLPDDESGIPTLLDADLGAGGPWVSRWGSDPIRPGATAPGWLLSRANFPGYRFLSDEEWASARKPDRKPQDAVVVPHALMPVPSGTDASPAREDVPAAGFISVALLTFEPRFDPEQEIWYADVAIDPLRLDSPFVRLGVVRFQPHAKRTLQVSEPVVEWAQVLPSRTVTARVTAAGGAVQLTVTSKGVAMERGTWGGRPEAVPRRCPACG